MVTHRVVIDETASMSGALHDLDDILASLDVARRDGVWTVVTVPDRVEPELLAEAAATIAEDEGLTLVLPVEMAEAAGFDAGFRASWLTLTVHSALEAVGLTAAFARALGDHEIPCNVLAGYHHDHLLVPVDRAEEAMAVLRGLRTG